MQHFLIFTLLLSFCYSSSTFCLSPSYKETKAHLKNEKNKEQRIEIIRKLKNATIKQINQPKNSVGKLIELIGLKNGLLLILEEDLSTNRCEFLKAYVVQGFDEEEITNQQIPNYAQKILEILNLICAL